MRYRLEGQEPWAGQHWLQLRPPEFHSDESGTHDGFWEADTEDGVIAAFAEAYPNRHPDAKPYLRFRVTPADAQRTFRIVEEVRG